MAKKKENPVEMSVETKLKSLYQLQTMLSEIDKIRILRGELHKIGGKQRWIFIIQIRLRFLDQLLFGFFRKTLPGFPVTGFGIMSHSLMMYDIDFFQIQMV